MHDKAINNNPYLSSRIEIFARNLMAACQATSRDWLIVEPYSIGDVYYSMALMRQFRDKWVEPGSRLIMLTNQRATPLGMIFPGIDMTLGGNVSPIEFQLETLAEQNRFGPGFPITGAIDMYGRGMLARQVEAGKMNAITAKKLIFNLDLDAPLEKPIINSEVKERALKSAMAQGMEQGKSVILINHSMGHVPLPDEFWQHVISRLPKETKVFTDVTTGTSLIPGTQPIRIALDEIITMAEYAGTCIAVRSGLVDVLSSAQCNFITLYPSKKYAKNPDTYIKDDRMMSLKFLGIQPEEKAVFFSKFSDLEETAIAVSHYIKN